MGALASPVFPSPPLKFRTVGFPQYGFKPDSAIATFALASLYATTCTPAHHTGPAAQCRQPGCRTCTPGPEALGSPAGCVVPPGRRLLWPHPSLSASPADFGSAPYTAGLCPWAETERFPNLLCVSVLPVPPSVPRWTGRGMTVPVSVRTGLRRRVEGLGFQQYPRKSVHAWEGFRGCKVRFMLRPGQLQALHRQGLLHSSFRLRSHLRETSNMTTRANSQFPRPDFHRLDTQPYGLQPLIPSTSLLPAQRCRKRRGRRAGGVAEWRS